MRNSFFSALLAGTLSVLGGCTFSSGTSTTRLAIELREGDELTGFDCFFANISGPNITPLYSTEQLNGADPQCMGLGTTSELFSAKDHISNPLLLKVPSGPARTVQIIGVKSLDDKDDACLNAKTPSDLFKAGSPVLYLVSSQTTDIYNDTKIDLKNQYLQEKANDLVASCQAKTSFDLAVTSVSPIAGPPSGGTVLTVSGTGFVSGMIVNLGSGSCGSVNVQSQTQLTCVTAAGAALSTHDLVVSNPSGKQGTVLNAFTYREPPVISNVAPAFGPLAGNQNITISGNHFAPPLTVTLGTPPLDEPCDLQSAPSATSIICKTRPRTAGAVAVTVTNFDKQAYTSAGLYEYLSPPQLTSITPNYGPSAGNSTSVISGTGFRAGLTVTIGGIDCNTSIYYSDTIAGCITPTLSVGAHDVAVFNGDGQPSTPLLGGYTVTDPPQFGSITPINGPRAGGTPVTIVGSNFLSGVGVRIGGAICGNLQLLPGQIMCTTGAFSGSGPVSVTITNADGQSDNDNTNAFTYDLGVFISNVNTTPPTMEVGENHDLAIDGLGFVVSALTLVRISGSNVCTVDVLSSLPTQIRCNTSGVARTGWTDVKVTNDGGSTDTFPNAYRVGSTPVWNTSSPSGAPSPRSRHTASRIDTGISGSFARVAIWGGQGAGGSLLGDGAIYNLNQQTWQLIGNTGDVPSARRDHTAVWSGERMIVWGGKTASGDTTNTGSAFDPVGNYWEALPTLHAPSRRSSHKAIWTGTEMVVFGGLDDSSGTATYLSTVGLYNPASGWRANIGQPAAFAGRVDHTVAHADGKVIVYGGRNASTVFSDGQMFNPYPLPAGEWTPLTALNNAGARHSHIAGVVNSTMVIHGGLDAVTGGDGVVFGRSLRRFAKSLESHTDG